MSDGLINTEFLGDKVEDVEEEVRVSRQDVTAKCGKRLTPSIIAHE